MRKSRWLTDIDFHPDKMVVLGEFLFMVPDAPRQMALPTTMFVLHLIDGNIAWEKSYDYAMISGLQTAKLDDDKTETTSPDTVFVSITSTDFIQGEGALFALNEKGDEVWRWGDNVQSVSDCAISDQLLAFTADSKFLVLLNAKNGIEIKRYELDVKTTFSAPLLQNKTIYVPTRGPQLVAIKANGRLLWRFQSEKNVWFDQTPIFVNGMLITSDSSGTVYALNAESGLLHWKTTVSSTENKLSLPVSDGEQIFIGARDGVYAINSKDGNVLWHFLTERKVEGQPVIRGTTLLFTCHDHFLYVVETKNGKERWRHELDRRIEAAPVLANFESISETAVIIADRSGTVTALSRKLTGSEMEALGDLLGAANAYAAENNIPLAAKLYTKAKVPDKAVELLLGIGENDKAAKLYSSIKEHRKAAKIWIDNNVPVKAAVEFEKIEDWEEAARAWELAGRMKKHAEALVNYGRSLANKSNVSDEVQAEIWEKAAKIFENEGELLKAPECWIEVSKYKHIPIVSVDVGEHDGLVCDEWTRLTLIVSNDGYGIARNLLIRGHGQGFDFEEKSTRRFIALRPEEERTLMLAVNPNDGGDSVPMQFTVEYQDSKGTMYSKWRTHYLKVVSDTSLRLREERQPLMTSAGMSHDPDLDARELRKLMNQCLNLDELTMLCFDMGIDIENLSGDTKILKIFRLIQRVAREHRLEELLNLLQEVRPKVSWREEI